MQETVATFDTLPNELHVAIAGYLDTRSLCFFAATRRRSLGNAIEELSQTHSGKFSQRNLLVNFTGIFCQAFLQGFFPGEIQGALAALDALLPLLFAFRPK